MGEVITVDFRSRSRVVSNSFFERFKDILRNHGIEEDDIAEVVDAIHDPAYFEQVEPDIQRIATIYFENTRHL